MAGDSKVGKTCLVARLVRPDKPHKDDCCATVGLEFDTHTLHTPWAGPARAQLWDVSGGERFSRLLLPTHFRKAKGVILVYNITDLKSFESLSQRWMPRLQDHVPQENVVKILVGNKSDLKSQREVPKEKALQFCKDHGFDEMFEASAASGENVVSMFQTAINMVHERAVMRHENSRRFMLLLKNSHLVVNQRYSRKHTG